MKWPFLLSVVIVSSFFQLNSAPPVVAVPKGVPPASSSQTAPAAGTSANTVVIPGPLRSFLRMAGMSQSVQTDDVLQVLARAVFFRGYSGKRPTEFLILLRRYYRQAKELNTLAGPDGNLHVDGCGQTDALLKVLGYKIRGECGHSDMNLVTADPERAFLTIDSGFPLLDLEKAMQHGEKFQYGYAGAVVPTLFSPTDWTSIASDKSENRDLAELLMYEPDEAQLYWALSQIEPATRAILKKNVGLAKLLPFASVLNLYGTQICIRSGAVLVPGGSAARKDWQELAGANPESPGEFVAHLLAKDHGWLAAYYDALARTNQNQQEHFAGGQRLKHYYSAFRTVGTGHNAASSMVFRPASALLVLVSRMQWDSKGDPYVPGSLQVWYDAVRRSAEHKIISEWGKRRGGWQHPDQLAEALFALSRFESNGPVQAYLCLTEIDLRRPPERRLSEQTVALLVEKYPDFGDQYRLFSEFPELTDHSINVFLNTAQAIDKISDHSLRGNAMGMLQANLGLWQILARQGQLGREKLNTSWTEVIEPFGRFTSSNQLLTAGRSSVESLLRASTGKDGVSQQEIIDLLAGTHQATTDGQRMHREMTTRIRSVLEDQQLVSIDTLFALDDGLKNAPQKANTETLLALAGELREFEMPQPIFTGSERYRWAAGTYNNRHTETQMRTNLAKVLQPSATQVQREQARGQLATFLRDTLVGLNYAYYEPPGSQTLHHNPLFVRSHDFSGETVSGVEHLWQAAELFGMGSSAGGGAHLIRSLADLPYVLAETEQDFISPSHVQALIWQQFVPGLLANAVIVRWWEVSRHELHAVALYQTAGEELLSASSGNEVLRGKVMSLLSDRLLPLRQARLEQAIQSRNSEEILNSVLPADTFYLATAFWQKFPDDFVAQSVAGRKLQELSKQDPQAVKVERLSQDFGVIHPVLGNTYARDLSNIRPFPLLSGNYSRLLGEWWDSGNLYWARLADEMGYAPVSLNLVVPDLTHRMVEKIFGSEIDDWPAILRALRETGEEVRQGRITPASAVTAKLEPGKD